MSIYMYVERTHTLNWTALYVQAIRKSKLLEAGVEHQLRREIEIQTNLRFQYFEICYNSTEISCVDRQINVLRMYGFFWDEKRIYLILEYSPGGEVYKILSKVKCFDEQRTAE